MIRQCERCGNPVDLLARDPYLPALRSCLCFSCERAANDAAAARSFQRADAEAHRAEHAAAA